MSTNTCTQCNKPVEGSDKFCPHCGTPVQKKTDATTQSSGKTTKTITSSGNYSGTMIKGKGSRIRKIMQNIIIAVVVVGIIALIVWIKTDPKATTQLGNIAFGLVFMLVFAFFIYRSAKKGKKGIRRDDKDFENDQNYEIELDIDDSDDDD